MYKIGVFAVFLWINYTANCQEAEVSLFKLWNKDDTLQWKDYSVTQERRILKTGFFVDAVTSYQYRFIPGDWDVYDCINVATLFVRSDSWVTDTLDPTILEHERIHFDIGELYARMLRKELHILFQEKNVNHEVYGLKIDSLFRAGKRYQDIYDQETFYGQIQSAQKIWKDRISFEMKQLEEFTFEKMQMKCNETSY